MFGGLFLIIPALGFLAATLGFTALAIWFWRKGPAKRPQAWILGVISAMFWSPIVLITISAIATQNARMTDAALFEHVLGFAPKLPDDKMMFDDHGDPRDGEILMRVYPGDALRGKIITSNSFARSDLTLEQFHDIGQRAGLSWWDNSLCYDPIIYETRSAPKWKEAYILDCRGFDALYGVFIERS
jgi:hypothetical protein